MARNGFDVHVAAICDPVGSVAILPDIHVHSLGIGRIQERRRPSYHAVALANTLRNLIHQLQPDVIHSWDANARFEIAWAKRFLGSRSIGLVETITGTGMPHSHIRQMIRNRIVPVQGEAVVPHESLINHVTDHGYPADEINVIPPAVSIDGTTNRIVAKRNLTNFLKLPDSIFLATAFAPLQPRFRLKDLVWATDLLTCIRDDFHLLIVGRGKQKTRLRKFASQTEAASHVHILDSTPSELTANDVLAGSDVYWNANLNLPLATPMLNSMAAGTPAISVLGEGTRDMIRHQETGFAVNFGARDEFARWTKYLIEQTRSADQLSRQGQDFVRGRYSVKSMSEAYQRLYNRLLNTKSASSNDQS
jgi:glycosyltransferase involved in cell wall biosynthesis